MIQCTCTPLYTQFDNSNVITTSPKRTNKWACAQHADKLIEALWMQTNMHMMHDNKVKLYTHSYEADPCSVVKDCKTIVCNLFSHYLWRDKNAQKQKRWKQQPYIYHVGGRNEKTTQRTLYFASHTKIHIVSMVYQTSNTLIQSR